MGGYMDKKYFISTLIIFVVWMVFGFIVHEVLLHNDYAQLSHLFRTKEDATGYLKYMILAHLLMSAAIVKIYRFGKEAKPFLGQGLRFGVYISLLCTVPLYLIYYAVQPMPGITVFKQIFFETAGVLVIGILVAKLES